MIDEYFKEDKLDAHKQAQAGKLAEGAESSVATTKGGIVVELQALRNTRSLPNLQRVGASLLVPVGDGRTWTLG